MKFDNSVDRHRELLAHLSSIPRRVLSLQGLDNIVEFVIHDLCSEDCFDVETAVYLVDNKNFNCLKGIAGYSRAEAYNKKDYWDNPKSFTTHMKNNGWHNNVRSLERQCLKTSCLLDEVNEIAKTFNIKNPSYHHWILKHDNCGLFLFETPSNEELIKAYMPNALYILSFCPIY